MGQARVKEAQRVVEVRPAPAPAGPPSPIIDLSPTAEEMDTELDDVEFVDPAEFANAVTPLEEPGEYQAQPMDFDDDDDDYDENYTTATAPPPDPTPAVTQTGNFMDRPKRSVLRRNRVQDLGVAVVTKAKFYDVRVTQDIGPIYIGDTEVKMDANRKYRVPADIFDYLATKGLVYGTS